MTNLGSTTALTINENAGTNYLGTITGASGSSVTITGGSQLTLFANNPSFAGSLKIQAGGVGINQAIPAGTSTVFGTGTIFLGNTTGTAGANLQFSSGNGNGYTFNNPITTISNGNVQLDSITVTQGAQTFGGLITLAHDLAVSNTNGSSSTLTLKGGITGTGNVSFNGSGGGSPFSITTGAVNITGTLSNISTNATGVLAISSLIAGNTALLENNAVVAPITLTGANNTYTGATTIQNGKIIAGATNTLSPVTTVTLGIAGSGNTATLDLGTGATSFSQTVAGLSALGTTLANDTITNSDSTTTDTATLTVNPDGAATPADSTFGGLIKDGTAKLALTKAGSHTLTLSGANSYTGTTTISGGTVVIGNATALGTVAGNTTIGTGATLDLNGQTIAEPFGTIVGTGVGGNGALINSNTTTAASITGDITGGTSAFTVGGAGNMTLGRVIFTSATAVTKVGAGTLTLSGATDNGFLGLTVSANSGTVILGKTTGLTVHSIGSTSSVASGSTVQLAGSGTYQIFGAANFTVSSGGVLDLNGQSQDYNSQTSKGGNLNLNGTGISSGGALINSSTAATSTITLGTGNVVLQTDSSIGGAGNIIIASPSTGAITSSGGLTKIGAGTLTLSTANTYTGGTTVTSGTLVAGVNTTAFGSNTGDLTINGGTVDFNGRSGEQIALLNGTGGTVLNNGSAEPLI